MNKQITEKTKCTGCGACVMVCTHNAIKMQGDAEGFLYPIIDNDKCVECNTCVNVCNARQSCGVVNRESCYVVQGRDNKSRRASSSGGIFGEIARKWIELGGYVYGASFDYALNVEHICVKEIDKLHLIQKSKYVQSNLKNTFYEVKKLLNMNKMVCYSGTPCQIAGLKAFLGKNYDNLLCIDVICQGVPGPLVWKKHIERLGKGERITEFDFRCKDEGWNHLCISYKHNNNKCLVDFENDCYLRAFDETEILRECCYSCMFRGKKGYSDITLGDCWGYDEIVGTKSDNIGSSVVIINTKKGKEILRKIYDKIDIIKKIDVEILRKYNKNLYFNPEFSSKRIRFKHLFECEKYEEAFNLLESRERSKVYYSITSKWLENEIKGNNAIEDYLKKYNMNKIAIYGMGTLGIYLYNVISKSRVSNIEYCIDSDKKNVENINVILSTDIGKLDFTNVDAIIVTPVHVKFSILNFLKKYYKGKIVGLDDILGT